MNTVVKRFLIALALFLLFLTSAAGIALAHPSLVTPQSAAVATEVACDGSGTQVAATATACGDTLYNQALTDLGLGKDYCFFDGQYSVNSQSCNQQYPPPINDCSGVFKGGLLSPTLATRSLNGTTLYLFQSNAGGCGSIWPALHDDTGAHLISAVTIIDKGNAASAASAYLTLPRWVGMNDWTSTLMLASVPKHTYLVSATVDGLFLTFTYQLP